MEDRFFPPGTFESPPRSAGPRAPAGSLHDPPLVPRDEAVFLLTAAAEIEHALMVQYLYAAYSVRVEEDDPDDLAGVRAALLQIAREEMGHLATVQNLLHVVGGPLTLRREHSAYAASIHPFRFRLEPLSRGSLARYVVAESPLRRPPDLPADDVALLDRIAQEAVAANDGRPLRHVGAIFERLAELVEHGLSDDDLRTDTAARHAAFDDWGYEPEQGAGERLIVDTVGGVDVAGVRAAALAAVRAIGAQGEGYDQPADDSESHFERFLELYRTVDDLTAAEVPVAWPVATDPNTTSPPTRAPIDDVEAAVARTASAGRIEDRTARTWAHLFNLRYRLLLDLFGHFLRRDQERYVDDPGPRSGDRTERGLLLLWTFDEMRHLAKIATKLVSLPLTDPPGAERAGPPFELPYSLDLPDGEAERFRTHLDVVRAAGQLVTGDLTGDEFLTDLLAADARAVPILESLARGDGIPPDTLPSGFAKVVTILEEAVRGFTIGGHGGFWTGRTRAEFVDPQAETVPVAHTAGGDVDPDPATAPLVRMLTHPGFRMPRFRPPVPPSRIEFLRRWIRAGAPDDDPPGAIGVAHERDPEP